MADAGRRGARAPRGAGRQAARRRRRPAARLACAPARASRCPACSTRSSTSGSTTSRSRGSPSRPRTSASPGTPTGASCRCSATSAAASPARRSRTRSRRPRRSAASRTTPSSTPTRSRRSTDRFKDALQGAHRRGLPAGPAGAAAAGDPRGVRLLDRRARGRLPAHQPHPRRLGHGGQRPADGVRQQGRQLGLRRRVQPRRGHRRARAVAATSSSTPRARTSSPACAPRATSPR